MEKKEILECHENFIRNTYEIINDEKDNLNKIKNSINELISLYSKFQDRGDYYQILSALLIEEILSVEEINSCYIELMVNRIRIFRELGYISDKEAENLINNIDKKNPLEIEYKIQLLKLIGTDPDSDEYEKTFNFIKQLKKAQ